VKVKVVTKILEANERIALENRRLFDKSGVYVINLMSGPGAGKTSILEKTCPRLQESGSASLKAILAGSDDAERIERCGAPVVQINTGGACHLDANMISEVLGEIPLQDLDLLFIENVGNLVCPAEFKVGEDIKVMVLSIAEGHDKPLKYPLMFQESSALLLNKIDLAPYLDVDMEKIRRDALSLNPKLRIFEVSCKTGAGLTEWIDWLKELIMKRLMTTHQWYDLRDTAIREVRMKKRTNRSKRNRRFLKHSHISRSLTSINFTGRLLLGPNLQRQEQTRHRKRARMTFFAKP